MPAPQDSEGRRKRKSTEKGGRPSKRHSNSGEHARSPCGRIRRVEETLQITYVPTDNDSMPVIVSAPGLFMPSDLMLTAYSKRKELLLQSSDHPTLNYIGRERQEGGVESQLKYYIGIYDDSKNEMQLMEAKHLTMRSTLRSGEQAGRREIETTTNDNLSVRQQLGMEFGTKKAKKSIASVIDNAIKTADPSELDSVDKVKHAIQADASASAVMDSMAAFAASAQTEDSLQRAIDNAKPRPKYNPDAQTVEEAYLIKDIVGEDIMRDVKVKPWFDALDAGGEVKTQSRFVQRRLRGFFDNDDVRKVKLLRYLLVLIQFLRACKSARAGVGKVLPKRDELYTKIDIDPSVIDRVRRKFAPGGKEMTKWDVDNTMTHMATISLILDNFETDTWDLREDLQLTQRQLNQYFKEIGARLSPMTEKQAARSKLKKEEAKVHKIAKLKLPLEFPKQRVIPNAHGR